MLSAVDVVLVDHHQMTKFTMTGRVKFKSVVVGRDWLDTSDKIHIEVRGEST